MRNGPWRNPLMLGYGGTPESVPSNAYWPSVVPSLVRRRLATVALRNLVQRKILHNPSQVSRICRDAVENGLQCRDRSLRSGAPACCPENRQAKDCDPWGLGGQPIAALKPELLLQTCRQGWWVSRAAVPACRPKKARRWCRQRLQGVHSAARYVPSPSRQDPAGPHGPLKAEAGVSCRRLPARPPAYFVLVSTADQFRSDILPNATRYQFMSKTAPTSDLES
jgi:hypothetical protein